jgi:hypothetical protein
MDNNRIYENTERGEKEYNIMIMSFKGRLLFYLFLGIFSGWIFYMMLSSYDPLTLNQPGFGWRREMVRFMLGIMSPLSWGVFIFILFSILSIASDWYYHRFKNLSEKG